MRTHYVVGIIMSASLLIPAPASSQPFDVSRDRWVTEDVAVSNTDGDPYSVYVYRSTYADGSQALTAQVDLYSLGISAMCPLAVRALTFDWNKGSARLRAMMNPAECYGYSGFSSGLAIDLTWTPDGAYRSSGHSNSKVYFGKRPAAMSQWKEDYWTATVGGTVAIDGAAAVPLGPGWGNTMVSRRLSTVKY